MNPHVAYLCSHYPALSHTFIQREIDNLRERGFTVSTFSVRPIAEADVRTSAMRAAVDSTPVLLSGRLAPFVRAHARLLLRHPGAWSAGLRAALRFGDSSLKAKVWQLFYLAEAVLLLAGLRRRGVRHVHVHHANGAADVARLAIVIGNRLPGADGEPFSWSLTVHGSTDFRMIHQWDIAAKLRSTSATACISHQCRAQMMTLLQPAEWGDLSIVRMGVDAATFAPPAQPRGHDGPVRVLSVGRLDPFKGFPLLVEAIADLTRRGVDVEVRIVGQGDLRDSLAEQIARLGLDDRLTLVGALGEDQVVEQFHWADVYVSASFMESLPVVFMEALATELPVVATNIGAVTELVRDGENGVVVPAADVPALAEAIARLATDPDLRTRMGKHGREAVLAEFTPTSTGPAIEEFMRRAMRA